MALKRKPTIVHLYVYGKIIGSTKNYIIDSKKIKEWIGRVTRMPDISKERFITEMIEMGLLKRINSYKYELLPINLKAPTDYYNRPLWLF